LPAQVSLALTLASSRLAKKDALVKQLASVETLGCVNVICTDKTGTLTKNEMTVKKVYLAGKIYDVSGSGYDGQGSVVTNPFQPPFLKGGDLAHENFSHDRKHFFL